MDERHEKVVVELTAPEAVVLFEALSRWAETDSLDVHLEHPAEQRVLWDLLAMLESALVEPLLPNYQDRLTRARELVQGEPE